MPRACKHATDLVPVCPECIAAKVRRAEYKAKYYAANRDAVLAQQKLKRGANLEKVRQRQRESYAVNNEKRRQRQRELYAANPEKYKKREKERKERNREAYLVKGRLYYQKNKEAVAEKRANKNEKERQKERDRVRRHNEAHPQQRLSRIAVRRALKYGVNAERFTIDDVIRRNGLACYICGLDTIPGCSDLKLQPTIEHTQPLVNGGGHLLEYAAIAHFSCNCSKGRKHWVPGNVPAEHRERCLRRITEYITALS